MKALITGGTSGIGRAIAQELDRRGVELIIVGLRPDYPAIEEYRRARYLSFDLSDVEQAYQLLGKVAEEDIDLFFDNAGFGDIGEFSTTDTAKEMSMVDLNCKTMQILLKEMLKRFDAKGSGRILVTSSMAAFSPSGYMATYYATKAYSLHLALGYRQELKDKKSKVTISVLCPGPVRTNFQKTADVSFKIKAVSAEKVGRLAIKKMLKGKAIIIPTFRMKALRFLSAITPDQLKLYVCSKTARKRNSNKDIL